MIFITSASFTVDVPEPDTEILGGLVEGIWPFFEPVDPRKPVTLHMGLGYFAGWNLLQPEFDIQIYSNFFNLKTRIFT